MTSMIYSYLQMNSIFWPDFSLCGNMRMNFQVLTKIHYLITIRHSSTGCDQILMTDQLCNVNLWLVLIGKCKHANCLNKDGEHSKCVYKVSAYWHCRCEHVAMLTLTFSSKHCCAYMTYIQNMNTTLTTQVLLKRKCNYNIMSGLVAANAHIPK